MALSLHFFAQNNITTGNASKWQPVKLSEGVYTMALPANFGNFYFGALLKDENGVGATYPTVDENGDPATASYSDGQTLTSTDATVMSITGADAGTGVATTTGHTSTLVTHNKAGQAVINVTIAAKPDQGMPDDIQGTLIINTVDGLGIADFGNVSQIESTSTGPSVDIANLSDDINISHGEQIINQGYLLTTDTVNVTHTGGVNLSGVVEQFSEDILISHSANASALQTQGIGLAHGSNVIMSGGKEIKSFVKIEPGAQVTVNGVAIFGGDAITSNGSSLGHVAGYTNQTSGGANLVVYGWKEEPQTVVVVNGGSVDLTVGGIEVYAPDISISHGGSVSVGGQKPEDILVFARPVAAVFRGMQIERSDITVQNDVNIMLTGVAVGGTIPDTSVPCIIFAASLVPGRCFVKGQVEDIPEISLDSSIELGVKLYSCDNTLLSPTTFTSAYFTFDDELQIYANLDTVTGLISALVTPADFSVLKRKKVYDMRLHAVDKQGNPSILLTRKLRFI